ncbi:protein paxx [Plakobranchus ocellatus]|uniref:Protein paxx n=1 Tax=Plakobranchus ocellatus TaxID=259542 RepID=A0AAV3YMQ7_9GAST|nr:protein paxx [Plakobranchus ocellatus]
MSDLTSLLQDANLDSAQRVVSNGRQKYLCFTKIKDAAIWVVSVTDGVDVWFLELDKEDLEAQRDLSGISSIESFLLKFSNGFSSGDVDIGRIGTKIKLTVGKGASAISLDLFEAKAAERKVELQALLFTLAGNCGQLEIQLSAANQQIEALKAQKSSGSGLGPLADLSPKKGQGQAKPKTAKVGMSVVNPSSRKRKIASGVVYD